MKKVLGILAALSVNFAIAEEPPTFELNGAPGNELRRLSEIKPFKTIACQRKTEAAGSFWYHCELQGTVLRAGMNSMAPFGEEPMIVFGGPSADELLARGLAPASNPRASRKIFCSGHGIERECMIRISGPAHYDDPEYD